MSPVRILLEKYKSPRATVFTGRPQGAAVREELKLDNIDRDQGSEVVFLVPNGVTSFNPSFYLGLLYPSFKKLGLDEFQKKYSFEFATTNVKTKQLLERDLRDGLRNAINSDQGRSILDIFKR
ncbi:MAG TPA: hypothetical protein VK183_01605 [Flavobacterium sp.]|nr:hypothetical protein [Flavobacterium sp.]